MVSASNPDVEKWKAKYYEILDRFDKKESDWIKTEKILIKALNRVIIVAEDQNPLIDHHLQALRAVLKEKFSFYRFESVLTELFNIVTEVESKSPKKDKSKDISIAVLTDILDGIEMPKSIKKRSNALVKELSSGSIANESISSAVKTLLADLVSTDGSEKSASFISKLFAKKSGVDKPETLTLLASSLAALPWPVALNKESKKLIKAVQSCSTEDELLALLKHFNSLVSQWPAENINAAISNAERPDGGEVAEQKSDTEILSVKQQCLSQFVSRLKSINPEHEKLQSIELADDDIENQSDQLAKTIAQMIELSSADVNEKNLTGNARQPEFRELFIQLLEQLVVPISLMQKAEEIKTYLEAGDNKDWRRSLKKVVQFINEVRFHQYQEEGGYEDFLQQITARLQEMVQFLADENKEVESSEEKGSELNKAVAHEVAGIKQGVESATTLDELQHVVAGRLDAISAFMFEHRQHEKERFDSAKENLAKMQNKINDLEKETDELKLNLIEKNKEAMYDALTGIPNRLFYDKRVKEDIGRWKRFDTPLSIAIWDVDKFKSVNDTYGHKAGDKVLKAIAQILNKRIRETDFLARYGGEEFAMLLPGTVEEETLRLANELRQAVESAAFHYNKEAVDITISCGISGFREGDALDAVFERADKALYQAKESGRNKCVIAGCRSD